MEEEQDNLINEGQDDLLENEVIEENEEQEEEQEIEEEQKEAEKQEIEEEQEQEETELEQIKRALKIERNKRKVAEKKIKETNKRGKTTYQTLIEQGIDEELAKTLSTAIDRPMQELEKTKFSNEVLVLKSKGFTDIEEYIEDIEEFYEKGLTVEQAYYATVGPSKKSNNTKAELQRQVEAKVRNQQQKNKILDVDTITGTLNNNKQNVKYSPLEIRLAKACGVSVEEYVQYRDIENINQYRKIKKIIK